MKIRKENIRKKAKFGKKMIIFCVTIAVMFCMFTISASADATTTSSTFLKDATNTLKVIVQLIGGGVAVWGIVNLLEGYGGDNAAAKSQGMKQVMAGIGLFVVATFLIPKLANLSLTPGMIIPLILN